MSGKTIPWNERTTDYPLGKIVKEGRSRLGLTQMEFAQRVGISQAYVSSMERGTVRMPDVDIRRRLAAALGLTHVELLIGSGELDADEVSTAPGLPPIRFHDMRHSHASWLLQAGVPVQVVSERLGHASVKMTLDRYAHLMPGMQERAADVVGEVLFGAG